MTSRRFCYRGARRWRWLWLSVGLMVAIPTIFWIAWFRHADGPPATVHAQSPGHDAAQPGVGCLGFIEPGDGIVRIAAPSSAGRVPIVRKLTLHEGDLVKKGQLIAEMDNRAELESALHQTEARVELARTRLAQVQAEPKAADIAAQRAEIGLAETQLAQARDELQRVEQLRQTGDATTAELTARQNAVQEAERSLEAARHRLAGLSEIRQSDVSVARAELDAAVADENRARTALAESRVYSPIKGKVLKVNARTGEQPGALGLVELAETDRMYAVAEVYESDIARVHKGQKAVVAGSLLPQPVTGVVETIGSQVTRLSTLPDDPLQFTDGRVVRVRIRLDEPERVAGLINAKVSIRIGP